MFVFQNLVFQASGHLILAIFFSFFLISNLNFFVYCGNKTIETFEKGDAVWSYDLETGEWQRDTVKEVFTREYGGELVTLTVGGEKIEATGNHPFWLEAGREYLARPPPGELPLSEQVVTKDGRWVAAESLRVGDQVRLRGGKSGTVERLEREKVSGLTVHNLHVVGNRNYSVGNGGVLVHNASKRALFRIAEANASKNAPRTGVVNPAELRWSQTTAGGRGRAAKYRESLARDGWKEGEFIDVVRTPDGLATLDHTRAAVALELNMTKIPARFHNASDALPADMLTRPWNRAGDTATTWGEALRLRGAGQTPPIGPTGSPTPPRLPR